MPKGKQFKERLGKLNRAAEEGHAEFLAAEDVLADLEDREARRQARGDDPNKLRDRYPALKR